MVCSSLPSYPVINQEQLQKNQWSKTKANETWVHSDIYLGANLDFKYRITLDLQWLYSNKCDLCFIVKWFIFS